jgi:hypothetical protein
MEQNQMSKFCINLEGLMLPDAIAAVVEAWYDAQNKIEIDDWENDLRAKIQEEYGERWIVQGHGEHFEQPDGKGRLIRIGLDRSRCSVVIPVQWHKANADVLYQWFAGICSTYLHNDEISSLRHAFEFEVVFQSKLAEVECKKLSAI